MLQVKSKLLLKEIKIEVKITKTLKIMLLLKNKELRIQDKRSIASLNIQISNSILNSNNHIIIIKNKTIHYVQSTIQLENNHQVSHNILFLDSQIKNKKKKIIIRPKIQNNLKILINKLVRK